MTRILIVDDQPDIRELLTAILELRGFEITGAASGVIALQQLDPANGPAPDLIILDVQMPEMDGWDTLSEIRERFGPLGPRVVICTVKGHPRDLVRGWTLGCDGYVWKPFDLKLLVDEVNAVLQRDDGARMRARRTAIGEAQMLLRAAV